MDMAFFAAKGGDVGQVRSARPTPFVLLAAKKAMQQTPFVAGP